MLGAVGGWLSAIGTALGLVRDVKDLVEGEADATVPDCPQTQRSGQAAGMAADRSQAATHAMMVSSGARPQAGRDPSCTPLSPTGRSTTVR